MDHKEESKNRDTSKKTDKLDEKEFEDGKPFYQPEAVKRERMPFPPPPSTGRNPPKSNTSSTFQTQNTNWK